MSNRVRRGVATGIVVAALAASQTATAGYAAGSIGYYGPQAGFSYSNSAAIFTAATSHRGYTFVNKQGSGTVPSGYMGAQARSYRNGVLCRSSLWTYNNAAASGWSASTSSTPCGNGAYNSSGFTRAYRAGGGYSTYATFQSPNQNYPG